MITKMYPSQGEVGSSGETSELQATMGMFVLLQLKSTMIIRCFLSVPWDPVCNLELLACMCAWNHSRCLFMLVFLGHTETLPGAAAFLGCFPDR